MERDPAADLVDRVDGVGRIAVLRANALGDLMFTLPALEALDAAYPEAEIVLLARPWHAALLEDRPGPVDRVLPVPVCEGIWRPPDQPEDPEEIERFFAAARAERFDLAVQLPGGGRYSNPFVRRLGARVTAGLRAPDAVELDRWVPYVYYQSEVLRFLEVVGLVGAPPVHLAPRLAVTSADLADARRVLGAEPAPASGGSPGPPLAVLHPGASDPRRRWPAASFAAVGDALRAAGAEVVVTGDEGEAALVHEVVTAMTAPALPLAGAVGVGGLAGLLSLATVVVANDTGPLHLAAAVGAATVGIYWCGNLVNAGPPTRARHRPAISWRLDCPTCGFDGTRGRCPHDESFVADVAVDEVLTGALDLLAHPTPRRDP